jgi:hypothetical protein
VVIDSDDPRPPDLEELLEAAEPNPLLRRVEAACEARAWDGLVELARRCREGYERGKQLWPIAEYIDYRLALEAPAAYAAAVLTPTAGRFALGPLPEVAASTHTFDALAAHVPSPQVAGVVAAERVLRGEDLRGRPDAHPEVLELPMVLQRWEPIYPLATYRAHEVHVEAPDLKPISTEGRNLAAELLDEPEVSRSLLDLVATWVNESAGSAEAVVVDGPAEAAVGAIEAGPFLFGEVEAAEALNLMAWAAASGGAHGRRRGAAAGRSLAWWAAVSLCGLEWPLDPTELGEELHRLRWYRWEPERLQGGWHLYLAVEDPEAAWAAALRAEDRAE